jgi:uncharacterized protein (TIGR02266 family)
MDAHAPAEGNSNPPQPSAPHLPADLQVRLTCHTVSQYLDRHAADVSRGGIFVRNAEVLPVGRAVRLNLQLGDGSTLLVGEGTVFWTREADPARAETEPGMGIRFTRLTPDSQRMLTFLLTEKAERERLEDVDYDGDERTVVATEAELRAAAESGGDDAPSAANVVQRALAAASALAASRPSAPGPVAVSPAPVEAQAQDEVALEHDSGIEPVGIDDGNEPTPAVVAGEIGLTDITPPIVAPSMRMTAMRVARTKRVGIGLVVGGAAMLGVWFGLLATPVAKPLPEGMAAVASAGADFGRSTIDVPAFWSAKSAGYSPTLSVEAPSTTIANVAPSLESPATASAPIAGEARLP